MLSRVFLYLFGLIALPVWGQMGVPIWCHAQASADGAEQRSYYCRATDLSQPFGFGTFEHGEWSLAVRLDGRTVWYLNEWAEPLLVSVVAQDMVVLKGKPFAEIELTLTLWCHSTNLLLWDVAVTNKSKHTRTVEVIPMARQPDRPWTNAIREKDYHAVDFEHIDDNGQLIKDIFAQFRAADGLLGWNSEQGVAAFLPGNIVQKTDVCEGQILTNTGDPARAWPGSYRLHLIDPANQDTLFTERSDDVIRVFSDGSLSVRTAALHTSEWNKLRFTAHFTAKEQTGFEYLSPKQRDDFKIFLGLGRLPPPVESIHLERYLRRNVITWLSEMADMKFQVFRRVYPSEHYVRIAKDLKTNRFEDNNPPQGICGYIIVATNVSGLTGIHSAEVNTVDLSDISEQLLDPRMFIGKDLFMNPPLWMQQNTLRGIGFYNAINLPIGASRYVRGYHAMQPADQEPAPKSEELYLLLSSDWSDFIKERQK
jgi:hypothetical protein